MQSTWSDWLRRRDDVASVADLVAAGVTRQAIAVRVRSGRWQRPLPRVIVAHSGPLSVRQRHRAALIYGGRRAALSHWSSAVLLGCRVSETGVHIAVPHGGGKPDSGFVTVHQAPAAIPLVRVGALPCVYGARTVVDVACGMKRLDDIRALVADAVQRHIADLEDLYTEVERAPRHDPRLLRLALDEIGAGARSSGEAEFLRLLRNSGLPLPELNAVVNVQGRRYVVDALWRQQRLIVEIDGQAWHLGVRNWESDLIRQNALHAAGFVVLRFPVRRLRDDPTGVLAELVAALRIRDAS